MDLKTVWSSKDLIMGGLAYTVMGILIVFLILVIIMMVIKAMALLSNNKETTQKSAEVPVASPVSAVAPSVKKEDGAEIIAVITAAIASMMEHSGSMTGFRIKSYRRINDDEWNKAARREALDNRF